MKSRRMWLALPFVFLFPWLCGQAFEQRYATAWPPPAEHHRVVTDDGWSLDLVHVAPVGGARQPRPVVLMHGVVTNGRCLDLEEGRSPARFLAAKGFDVWMPSLRDTGNSEHRPLLGPGAEDVDFDDYALHDVPALMAYVRRMTGASEVDWVGHSMGGLLAYAHLATGGAGLGRVVTLGSPVAPRTEGSIGSRLGSVGALSPVAPWLPVRTVVHAALPLQGVDLDPAMGLFVDPLITPGETWRHFLAMGVDDVPAGLARQLLGWAQSGRFTARDGRLDYLEALARVRQPVFVVASRGDRIAPPASVRPAYDALENADRRWLLVSREGGALADYGHMDQLFSVQAQADVWRPIAAFLAEAR